MNIKEIYNAQTALIIELQNSLSIMAGAKISAKDLLRTHRVERTVITEDCFATNFKDCIEKIRLAFDAIEESITDAEWQRELTGKKIIEQHISNSGFVDFEIKNVVATIDNISFDITYEDNPHPNFLNYSLILNIVTSRNLNLNKYYIEDKPAQNL